MVACYSECNHCFCKTCAIQLGLLLQCCPLCRSPIRIVLSSSADLNFVFVTFHADTSAQSPQYRFDIPEFIRRHLRRLRRANENDVMQRILVTFVFDCIPYKKEDLQFEWDCYI